MGERIRKSGVCVETVVASVCKKYKTWKKVWERRSPTVPSTIVYVGAIISMQALQYTTARIR